RTAQKMSIRKLEQKRVQPIPACASAKKAHIPVRHPFGARFARPNRQSCRFVEPMGSFTQPSPPHTRKAPGGAFLSVGAEGGIDGAHPCAPPFGARFARPNRQSCRFVEPMGSFTQPSPPHTKKAPGGAFPVCGGEGGI